MRLFLVLSLLCVGLTSSTEIFAVLSFKLSQFINPASKLLNGNCCNQAASKNGSCISSCKTAFLVSVRPAIGAKRWNYLNYGISKTTVIGEDRVINANSVLKFNIARFSWRGDCQILIAAFNVRNENESFGIQAEYTSKRIFWKIIEKRIIRSDDFSQEQNSSDSTTGSVVTWSSKLECTSNYHNNICGKYCESKNNSLGHYKCDENGNRVCLKGWKNPSGTKPCTQISCPEGCVEKNSYQCTQTECKCKEGWKGKNCDQCMTKIGCLHGTCSSPNECSCIRNWTGALCDIDENYCSNNEPCRHGGLCRSGASFHRNFTCTCQRGYMGANCQLIKYCSLNPCNNGGTCKEFRHSYECKCTDQFQGKNCEISKCSCLNGGTCPQNTSVCHCPERFMGEKCEIMIPETTETTHDKTTTTTEMPVTTVNLRKKNKKTTNSYTTKSYTTKPHTTKPYTTKSYTTKSYTTKPTTVNNIKQNRVFCSINAEDSSKVICGQNCNNDKKCLSQKEKLKCLSNINCPVNSYCHETFKVCICSPGYSGEQCKRNDKVLKVNGKKDGVMTPRQLATLSVVAGILIAAIALTVCVVKKRRTAIRNAEEQNYDKSLEYDLLTKETDVNHRTRTYSKAQSVTATV